MKAADSAEWPIDARIRFLKLRNASEAILDDFYESILKTTFPTSELEPLEDFKNALKVNADGIAALIDGVVCGGIVYEHYVHGSVQLLGYVAVSSALRGRGLGAQLVHLGRRESDSVLALGEIEDPRHWSRSPSNDPVSRLRFWVREGCKLLPLAYVQPALRSDSDRVRHLLLIAVPRADTPLPDSVPGQLVASFLREYYLATEGSILEEDSEFQRLIAECSVERLRLWPLDRLDVVDRRP